MDASQPNAQNTDAASLGFIVLWCFIPPSSFRSSPPISISIPFPTTIENTQLDGKVTSYSLSLALFLRVKFKEIIG